MEFEVASIHLGETGKFTPPNMALDSEDNAIPAGGRFFADFPLETYIQFAWKIMPTREQRQAMLAHLPGWVTTQSFVIEARAPMPNPTKDQIRLMVQSLLADRFKLTDHFESKETPVLAMVLAKPGVTGPRLRPHEQGLACDAKWTAPPDRTAPSVPPGGSLPVCNQVAAMQGPDHTVLLSARNLTLGHIATYLPTVYNLGRPVVDQTGLPGTFDFTLQWQPDQNAPLQFLPESSDDLGGTPFFDALKEQLGLRLKPATAVIPVLVIDHVEQPSAN
jgi:bla regulator protein blaR1